MKLTDMKLANMKLTPLKLKQKREKREKKNRFSLTLTFSLIIFAILFIAALIATVLAYIFLQVGWFEAGLADMPGLQSVLVFMFCVSLVIGFGFAMLTVRYPLQPFNRIIAQMNRLAEGDFKARLRFGKHVGSISAFKDMSDSFNKMAEELEGTEMLRADFINNFSHEFKTPIVSIAGFAKLLKRGDLTPEQRQEYISIIEEESMRLSYMATNVLNLTKVENQSILADVTQFNLSEQIRSCILLLENKWTAKNLELLVDFDEYTVLANEEQLKQVWINLLDNAVKFTPEQGVVEVKIREDEENVLVSISNSGSEISPENMSKIFNKFYQADESHASEGNGVGLAIVKKITQLHGGDVWVESGNGMTTFTVGLPQ